MLGKLCAAYSRSFSLSPSPPPSPWLISSLCVCFFLSLGLLIIKCTLFHRWRAIRHPLMWMPRCISHFEINNEKTYLFELGARSKLCLAVSGELRVRVCMSKKRTPKIPTRSNEVSLWCCLNTFYKHFKCLPLHPICLRAYCKHSRTTHTHTPTHTHANAKTPNGKKLYAPRRRKRAVVDYIASRSHANFTKIVDLYHHFARQNK